MQITETLSDGLKREFKVVIGADDMEQRVTDRLTALAREARMPGFRPGKVPVKVLRRTHGKYIMGEVLEQAVNETTSKALEERELKPALQPRIEVTQFEEGKDLEYTVAVEIMPEIEAGDFSTLSLEKLVADVPDSEVESRLGQLAEQLKNYEDAPDDRAAESGDQVTIDFVGKIDGTPFEGGKAEDFDLRLGSGTFIPGFEDGCIGLKKGDEKTIAVTFPEEYGNKELAGKPAEFDVTVKKVQVAADQPIDDSLATKLGAENLEALKTMMREQLERDYGELTRAKLKRSLLDALAERYTFEVPAGLVDAEFEQIWEQVKHDIEHHGRSFEDEGTTEEAQREEYRKIAERRVRLGLLLSDVGQRNNLQVTQEEVNRAIAQFAQRYPGQEAEVARVYRENPQLQMQLQAPILEDKVVDFIVELADVTEKKVPIEELMKDDEDEDGHEHHHHHDHDHDHDHDH